MYRVTTSSSQARPLKGFTLIELLVVIAIIALLAAILFPVFARARENARRASCQSNLKQIGLGVLQYTQDYDEFYPHQGNEDIEYYADPSRPEWIKNWIHSTQPYIKSWQVFDCPSASPISSGATPIGNSRTNYAMSGVIVRGPSSGQWGSRPLKVAAVNKPSEIIMVHELNTVRRTARLIPYAAYSGGAMGGSSDGFRLWTASSLSSVHFDGGNLLFADGHVKWKKQETICASDFGLVNTGLPNGGCGVYSSSSLYQNVDTSAVGS